jgi:hypothetical protein
MYEHEVSEVLLDPGSWMCESAQNFGKIMKADFSRAYIKLKAIHIPQRQLKSFSVDVCHQELSSWVNRLQMQLTLS